MVDQITQFDYHYLITDDETPRAAEIVNAVTESGIELLAFSEFPHGPGKVQVDLITGNADSLEKTATEMGWALSERKSGFLIQGEDRPNAIGAILDRLAEANVSVTAVQAIAAGAGRFGALLWVKPLEVERAAQALRASMPDPSSGPAEEYVPDADIPVWILPQVG